MFSLAYLEPRLRNSCGPSGWQEEPHLDHIIPKRETVIGSNLDIDFIPFFLNAMHTSYPLSKHEEDKTRAVIAIKRIFHCLSYDCCLEKCAGDQYC